MEKNIAKPRVSSQLMFGIVIVAAGVLLLLQSLNIVDISAVTVWIPSLFVLLGVWLLLSTRGRQWVGPLLLIVFSGAAQLAALDIVSWADIWRLWPLALVFVGVSILLNRATSHKKVPAEPGDTVNAVGVFSGSSTRSTSQAFNGGELTAVFGGIELDLREVQVTEPPAVLNTFVMFGGMEIQASPDMIIETRITPLFGGFEDSRKQRKQLPGESAELIIQGNVLFGGLELK